MRSLRLGVLALALAVPLLFTGPTSARVAAGCSVSKITPVLRDITINQGLQTYSTLARGKETLVRLYMSLPSCATSGQSVQINAVRLTATLTDASSGASVASQTFTPLPSLSSPGPQITNLSGNPPLTQIAPSDPVFILPGSFLAPSTDTNRLTLTVSASLDWTPINPSGTIVTGTPYTSNNAGTSMSKTIEKQTRALRLLVVPMGNSLLDATATTAIQNGMTSLSREYPVPDGTPSGSRVGSLTSTNGGIRFTINGSFLDLTASPLSLQLPFCGTPTAFGSTGSGGIDTQLSQFRQSWNSANAASPNYLADNVVGAISESQSIGSAQNSNCDEARAAVNGRESWVRAVSDKTTTLALPMDTTATTLTFTPTTAFPTAYPFSVLVDNEVLNVTGSAGTNAWTVTRGAAAAHATGAPVTLLSTTGALMAMEIEHNYGYVPLTRGDANYHSLYAHADHNTGDAYRGYNVTGRQFLPDNRSNMRFTPPGWTNLTTILEPQDWGDLLCNLGGATTTECATAGTTGTAAGTAAGLSSPSPVPSFVMSGTTDGQTMNGTNVLESYTATTLPTPDDPTSTFHVVQLPSGQDDKVPVNFNVSNHTSSEPSSSSSVGLFSVAVPLRSNTTRIEFRNGSGTVLYTVNNSNAAPTISASSPIVFRALAADRRTQHRARRHRRPHRRLAANGDLVKTITANQDGTACATKSLSAIGTGIAFDGSHLLLSCWNDNTITMINPSGQEVGTPYTVTSSDPMNDPMSTLGALAYDSTRNVLWACNNETQVGTIDLVTHVFTKKFTSPGCVDGLAYDGTDDTLWTSPDATSSISHWRASDGTQIGSTVGFTIGSCGNSGIAVGGSTLYLANDGCSQIWTSSKTDFSSPQLFATLSGSPRVEDLECDNVSFAGQGKTALWSVDAYDNTVSAWEIPPGSCTFGGGTNITYTINSTAANVTSDIFLKCPNNPVFNVVRVGIPGTSVSIPQTSGCAGGTFYAEAYDGFSSSGAPTPIASSTLSSPPTLPFKPSVTSPYPGQAYSVNDDISLVGSAFDYSTNTAASLQWLSDGAPIATGQQADVRASTLGIGSHTIRLQATAPNNTASVDVPITISDDADGDGIAAPQEQVIHDCAVSKNITSDGGDHDPTNGTKDYDNDGIPNRDDPFPCTPAGSYMASAAVFKPNPLSLSGMGSLSAGGMLVPFRDMTQVIQSKGMPSVFIKSIGLGEAGSIDVNEQASNYAANGSIGAAGFARQPLIGILSANNLVNRTITLTIVGNAVDPLSGPWSFTAIVPVSVTK